jgi:hypothetical protein
MNETHDEISADENDLSEATLDTMEKTLAAEYNVFNFVVLERIILGTLKIFFDKAIHPIIFAKVTFSFQLLDAYATIQASIADAKRDFSLMNNIKTKSHYKLEASHLEMSVHIKFYLVD